MLRKIEKKDMGVGTDFNRRLLAPTDWFYSQLFRRLLKQHFAKKKLPLVEDAKEDFDTHDQQNQYREVNEPSQSKKKTCLLEAVTEDNCR